MVNGFLLGIIVVCSLVAAAFFLKFWRQTRDPLFIGFGIAFFVEACNRVGFLFLESPTEGNPLLYTIRFVSYLIILIAIAHKNRRSKAAIGR